MFIKTVIHRFTVGVHEINNELLDHKDVRKFDEEVNKAVRELKAPNPSGTFVRETYVQSHVEGLQVTLIASINYTKRDQ